MGLNKKRVKEGQVCMESRKMVQMSLLAGQKQRCRHTEQTHGLGEGSREREELEDQNWHIYTTKCIAGGKLLHNHRELSSVHCDDLQGWDGEEVGMVWRAGSGREGTCVRIQLIHFVVQQKLTQYCNAITRPKKRKGKAQKRTLSFQPT